MERAIIIGICVVVQFLSKLLSIYANKECENSFICSVHTGIYCSIAAIIPNWYT